jgi:hypothetical protein
MAGALTLPLVPREEYPCSRSMFSATVSGQGLCIPAHFLAWLWKLIIPNSCRVEGMGG